MIRLYQDEGLWNRVSQNARHFVTSLSGSEAFDQQVKDILNLASGQTPILLPAHAPRLIRQDRLNGPIAPAPIRLSPRKAEEPLPEIEDSHLSEAQEEAPAIRTLTPRVGISLPLSEL